MRATIHPTADVLSADIGPGTRIWQFVVVLPAAKIGAECNICAHVFVENDVIVGDRVTVKSGVQLWDGITIGDDVFVGPNATFTNDKFPRSKHFPALVTRTHIADGASIGANSVILPGIEIGKGSMVGAGAVVTRSVPAYAIVIGNPARIVGYTNSTFQSTASASPSDRPSPQTLVKGVEIQRMKRVADIRGSLCVGEFERDLPFIAKRFFLVFGVPSVETRGAHAHRACHQFLICAAGSCSVVADDGQQRQEFLLDRPDMGLYLPPMTWGIQYKYSANAVLLVFASHYYDADDYIRDYEDFLVLRGGSK